MDTQTRTPVTVSTPDTKLTAYRQAIIRELKHCTNAPSNGEIQTVAVFDTTDDHYQILDIGWDESGRRVFQPIIHVDLINTKVWIQENMSDIDIAKVFVEAGISSSDIVLGLHSRSLRQFSEYATE